MFINVQTSKLVIQIDFNKVMEGIDAILTSHMAFPQKLTEDQQRSYRLFHEDFSSIDGTLLSMSHQLKRNLHETVCDKCKQNNI